MPFSIDAALSGTVSSYKPEPVQAIAVPTLDESLPSGWMFDIHEDTPDEETGNVISFSFQTVDISDDESRRAAKDDRGKENIPPADYPSMSTAAQSVATTRSASRQDIMTDEPRTPLGDLDTADFYADGCDASSYIIVPAEKCDDNNGKSNECRATTYLNAAAPAGTMTAPDLQQGWDDLLTRIDVTQKVATTAAIVPLEVEVEKQSTDIEIWESESAKGDDDVGLQHTFQSPLENTLKGSLGVETHETEPSDVQLTL